MFKTLIYVIKNILDQISNRFPIYFTKSIHPSAFSISRKTIGVREVKDRYRWSRLRGAYIESMM